MPGAPEFIGQMLAALDTYDSVIPMEETARTFGVQLTSVEEFARRDVSASVRDWLAEVAARGRIRQ